MLAGLSEEQACVASELKHWSLEFPIASAFNRGTPGSHHLPASFTLSMETHFHLLYDRIVK